MAVAASFSWPQYRSCAVKRRYRSLRLAQLYAYARRIKGERFHAYGPCEFCAGYHCGHYAERAVTGTAA